MRTKCRYQNAKTRNGARHAPKKAKVLHSGRRLPAPRIQTKRIQINRNMLLNSGASMIGNDSGMLLTTGFVSDSSTPESEADVLVLSAAAAGAAAASVYTSPARAELQKNPVATRLVCSSAD
jgi:hypothetical protein